MASTAASKLGHIRRVLSKLYYLCFTPPPLSSPTWSLFVIEADEKQRRERKNYFDHESPGSIWCRSSTIYFLVPSIFVRAELEPQFIYLFIYLLYLLIYLLQFNDKELKVSDKKKGIAIRSVKESKTPYKTDHLLKNINIIKTKII